MTENIIERVRRMEAYMNTVQNAVANGTTDTPEIVELRRTLSDYMESGQWMSDYAADERGELPAELKRGVLSQDLLYDLLTALGSKI